MCFIWSAVGFFLIFKVVCLFVCSSGNEPLREEGRVYDDTNGGYYSQASEDDTDDVGGKKR